MAQDVIAPRGKIGKVPQLTVLAGENGVLAVVHDDLANPTNISAGQITEDSNGPTHRNFKARGTLTAPANVQDGDRVFDFTGSAYSGGTIFENCGLRATVDGAFVSGQAPPMRLVLRTGLANAAEVDQAAVFSNGCLVLGTDKIAEGVANALGQFNIGGNATVESYLERSSSDVESAKLVFRKTRGTLAAPTNVADADILGSVRSQSLSNTIHSAARMDFLVDGAVVAGQAPGSRSDFHVNRPNAGVSRHASLRATGNWTWGLNACDLSFATLDATVEGHLFGQEGTARHLNLRRATTSAEGYNLLIQKSRGTLAAPTNVTTSDRVMRIEAQGYSGASGFWSMARIECLVDAAVVDNQRPASRLDFYTNKANTAVAQRMRIDNAGNIGVNTTSFGASSEGVVGVGNAAVVPTGNPTSGGVLYAEAGAGKWRGSGGTITTFGAADPHCPNCGRDFAMEWEHDGQKFAPEYFAVCLHCLVADIETQKGPRPYVMRAKVKTDVNTLPEVPKGSNEPRVKEAKSEVE